MHKMSERILTMSLITEIEETKKYIKSLSSLKEKRNLNQAINKYMLARHNETLKAIKYEVFNYIKNNESDLSDIAIAISKLSELFDDKFDPEFDPYMKKITYIILYKIYEQGGEI